ncbi:MAG: DUF11 domain-containing protein, partial [Deltaproteobacteria bacterium]|nr:DUF11 domain-containing protein [Deltaproteobacteria bacterium]
MRTAMPELRPVREATRAVALCALAAALLAPVPAQALLSGTPPSYVRNFRLWGSAAVTGNTLMYDDGTVNFALIPGGTDGIVDELPTNAEVEAAYLFWSASYNPGSPDYVDVDRDVDFSIPAGRRWRNLSIDALEPGEDPASISFNRCIAVDSSPYGNEEYFYSCRRDVTAMVRAGGSALNGNYHVGGVEAVAGNCSVDPLCQAKYAGWSLIIVWSSASERVRRDVVLFDGFYLFDEDAGPPFTSGISPYFTLANFEVGSQPRGFLSYFALEGDEQLGVPPQDLQGCPTCYDFFELYTQQNTTPSKLTDDVNPPNNVYNGSRSRGGSSPGVDLDTFDISSRLRTGDTFLRFRVGSGDGLQGGESGGGELVLLSYVIVSLDTFAPNFLNAYTAKSVAEEVATPGAILHYTVRVTNDGSAPATQVTVTDAIPSGTTYVANSTTVCGSAVADVNGQSPLVNGVNIGTLYERPPGRQSCEIRFQVRVNGTAAPGSTVTNRAVVTSAETEPLTLSASTRIEGLRLAAPTKTALDVNGGDLVPGDVVSYTVTVRNDTDAAVAGLSFTDAVPPELENVAVLAVPSGAVDRSAGNQIAVDAIRVAARSTASIIFNGQVRAGVPSGTPIVNQGYLSHPSLPEALATDDPATPAAGDPTILVVHYAVDLSDSIKAGIDVNGGAAEPGDLLRYSVTLTNSGSVAATVSIEDNLPLGLERCALVYRPPGSTVACYPGGSSGSGVVRGQVVVPANSSRQVVFEARIISGVTAGLVITNRADVTYAEDPSALLQLVANSFTVVAGPVLTRSSKLVEDLDGAPTRPGDRLRYVIVVRNAGNRPATNVEVRDVVDGNLVDIAPGQGGQLVGSEIRWTASTTPALASIDAGAEVRLSFEATVRRPLPDRTQIRNSAELRSDEITTPVVVTAAVVTVVAQSRLALSKTVADLNAPPYQPRDRVRYTLTLTNSGDAPATQVAIVDPVDGALENPLPDSGGRVSGDRVIWDASGTPALAQVDPGALVVLTFEATIRDRVDDGALVSNQATARAAPPQPSLLSDDPALPGSADPTVFRISAPSALTLTKSVVDDNGGQFVPGESITYTIVVGNSGLGPALDVAVSDSFPAQLERLVGTPAPSLQSGNTLTWDRSRVPALARIWPGEQVEIVVTARIVRPLADGTAVSNQALAVASGGASAVSDDPATPAAGDPTVFFVRSMPVLSDFTKRVAELDGDGSYRPGDRVRYTLRITNTGSEEATAVAVSDTVPLQIGGVVAADGRVSGNHVEFDPGTEPALGRIAVDGFVELTIEGVLKRPLDPGTPVSNQASVVASGLSAELSDDPTTTAVDDPTTFRVTSAPDLSALAKRVSDVNGGVVAPGDELSYQIEVVNRGDADALDLVVSDPIDGNLTVLVVGSNGRRVDDSLVWDAAAVPAFARLAPGVPVVLTFSARIATPLDNNTRIADQAQAAARGLARPELSDDPATAAVDDPTVVYVISASNLSTSTKRALDGDGQPVTTARPGQTVHYRIELLNTGDAVARDIAVVDPIDANLVVSAIGDGGVMAGGEIRWDGLATPALAALAPGRSAVLNFAATLRTPLDNGLVIPNQAELQPGDAVNPFVSDDPSTGEPGDPTRITVVSNPDLSATTKAVLDANGGEFEPGDHIRYQITILNGGDALARGVVVDDPIDMRYLRNVTAVNGAFDGTRVRFDPSTEPALAAVGVGAAEAVLLTIEADIAFPLADGIEVANQATVAATGIPSVVSDDPATPQVDDSTRFTVRAIPRIALRKVLVSPAERVAPPGGDVVYRLEIENPGTAPTTAVALTDILPPEVVFVSTGRGTFDEVSRTLTVDLGALQPRAPPIAFDVLVRVREDLEGGAVANQARAMASNVSPVLSDDPQTALADDPTVFDVRAIVDLSASTKIALDVDGGLLRPGDLVRYTISVVNQGNTSARDVVVSDPLPLGLEIESVEEGGRSDGQTATWDPMSTPALSRVAVGVPVDLHLVARVGREVADGTRLDNQALLTTGSNAQRYLSDDPATADVLGDPTTIIVSAPRLGVTKAVADENGGSVRPGDVLAYTIALRNDGSAPLRRAEVRDLMPAGTAVEEIGDGGQLSNGVIAWDATTSPGLAQIEPGQEVQLHLRLRVDRRAVGGQVIANQAQVFSDDLVAPMASDDPSTAAAGDPTAVTVDARVELEQSVKRVASAPDPLRPGDEVRFEIAITNSGTQYANRVVVTDRIEPEMFDQVAVDQNGRFANGTVTWSAPETAELVEIEPGQTVVLSLSCRVAAGVRNNVYVENAAHLEEASGV